MANLNVNNALMQLADPSVWERGAYVLVGAAVPAVAENVVGGMNFGVNIPGEAYGAATAAGLYMFAGSGKFRNYATAGALANTGFQAADRFGLVDTVENLGA